MVQCQTHKHCQVFYILQITHSEAHSQNCEKQLASSCVCLSIRPSAQNNTAPTGQIFIKFGTYWKFVKKIQVSLKSDKTNGHLKWKPMYIYDNILKDSS